MVIMEWQSCLYLHLWCRIRKGRIEAGSRCQHLYKIRVDLFMVLGKLQIGDLGTVKVEKQVWRKYWPDVVSEAGGID